MHQSSVIDGFFFWIFFKMKLSIKLKRTVFIIFVVIVVFSLIWSLIQFDFFSTIFSAQKIPSKYLFGTLDTANGRIFTTSGLSYAAIAKKEHDVGIAVAHIEIAWKDYEIADGVFDENLMRYQINDIAAFLQADQKVDVQLSIHYTPSWVMQIPDAYYIDQYGVTANQPSADPNYVFNATVRQKVQDFEIHTLHQLNAQIGLNNIWDFRIDGGEQGEVLYPSSTDSQGHINSYWAYDNNAQGTGHNLPSGINSTPFPDWQPGQKTYHNLPFTAQQIQQWYNWYFNSRMNYYNWQINLYRSSGFKNYLSIETPGFGTRPDEYAININHYLDGSGDPNGTMSRAAVWQNLYPSIVNKSNVIAYISSMADSGSKTPYDVCQSSDASVDFNNNPLIDTWGPVRYISYIANKYGLLKDGENPGYSTGNNRAYGITMMDKAASEMASCGLIGMFWAHDERLYTTTSVANTVTLTDYASIINQYNFNTVRVEIGASYIDSQGNPWSAERDFTGVTTSKIISSPTTIAGTVDPTLYRSCRYGTSFNYHFIFANGNYIITLKFAELQKAQIDQKIFNVIINGKVVLENFDVLSQVAPNTALDKTFPLIVRHNNVTISFNARIGTAMISAIQIAPTAN